MVYIDSFEERLFENASQPLEVINDQEFINKNKLFKIIKLSYESNRQILSHNEYYQLINTINLNNNNLHSIAGQILIHLVLFLFFRYIFLKYA